MQFRRVLVGFSGCPGTLPGSRGYDGDCTAALASSLPRHSAVDEVERIHCTRRTCQRIRPPQDWNSSARSAMITSDAPRVSTTTPGMCSVSCQTPSSSSAPRVATISSPSLHRRKPVSVQSCCQVKSGRGCRKKTVNKGHGRIQCVDRMYSTCGTQWKKKKQEREGREKGRGAPHH